MKKTILSIIFLAAMFQQTFAQETSSDNSQEAEEVELSCSIIDDQEPNTGIPRTPPRIPIVYFNRVEFSFVFDSPCYDCTLYLVDVTNDMVVYTALIPSGRDIVYIPSYLSGEYELHIHRGNICFYGKIILF